MPSRIASPAPTNDPFLGSTVVTAGLVTPGQLRSRRFTRLFRDCYVGSGVPLDHAVRCRALALVLPSRAVFVGWSAAALYDVRWVDPELPVVIRVPHGLGWGPVRGVVVTRAALGEDEIAALGQLRVASPERVLVDLAARSLPAEESVVLVDAALARWPVLSRDLPGVLERSTLRHGRLRARRLLALADGGAESPMESRLRALLVLEGLPRPETQCTVRDSGGRFVARVDLGWPALRAVVEYDGLWHGDSDERFQRDRRRLNALVAAGWQVHHVTVGALATDPGGVVAAVRELLRAAAAVRSADVLSVPGR